MSIKYRKDMYNGEEGHPQCCFFEAFPSSSDPYEDFYGFFACHMSLYEKHAEICKGDYLKCPISKGRLASLTNACTGTGYTPCAECGEITAEFLCKKCWRELDARP